MMEGISSEIVLVIYQLLPGFIVAWIIYSLTAHLKPSPFERVIQALIFTVFVRVFVILLKLFAEYSGEHIYSFGTWNEDVEFIWSIIIAIVTGLFITWCVNNDFPLFLFRKDGETRCPNKFKWLCKLLSKIKLTDKTLHPTEWYSAFNSEPRFIVLHLSGGRRLYGSSKQYPDDPNKGHFLIEEPEWLLDDGSSAPLHTVHHMLIPASDVQQIEFIKNHPEIKVSEEELTNVTELLTKLYKKESKNVNQCPETTATDTTTRD
jgi:hypothetical protein